MKYRPFKTPEGFLVVDETDTAEPDAIVYPRTKAGLKACREEADRMNAPEPRGFCESRSAVFGDNF